jgi:anti-sigma regulatory factor (Ser/Thr protein kinase)
VEHGGKRNPEEPVRVTYERTTTELRYRIKDPGKGFAGQSMSHTALEEGDNICQFPHLGVREQMGLRPGGFGILIARHLVDELTYNAQGNEVLIVKRLPSR